MYDRLQAHPRTLPGSPTNPGNETRPWPGTSTPAAGWLAGRMGNGTLQDFPAVTAIDVSGRRNLSGEPVEKLVELLIPQFATTRQLGHAFWQSEPFWFRRYRWTLTVCPTGHGGQQGKQLAVFLARLRHPAEWLRRGVKVLRQNGEALTRGVAQTGTQCFDIVLFPLLLCAFLTITRTCAGASADGLCSVLWTAPNWIDKNVRAADLRPETLTPDCTCRVSFRLRVLDPRDPTRDLSYRGDNSAFAYLLR